MKADAGQMSPTLRPNNSAHGDQWLSRPGELPTALASGRHIRERRGSRVSIAVMPEMVPPTTDIGRLGRRDASGPNTDITSIDSQRGQEVEARPEALRLGLPRYGGVPSSEIHNRPSSASTVGPMLYGDVP